MKAEEKEKSFKRKINMKIYKIHKMLTADLLFYYAIEFIFLTQVKQISISDIVLANAAWGILQFVFQLPTTALMKKIGNKRSIILSDLIAASGVIVLMACDNIYLLLVSYSLSAIAFALRSVAESAILNKSIASKSAKSNIFADIEAKGLSKYYYISAVASGMSGLLFNVNPYIPLCICTIILLISAFIATRFNEIKQDTTKIDAELSELEKIDLKKLEVLKSKKINALILYSALLSGIILVLNNYEKGFLQEINISIANIGVIYAIMQVVTGIASRRQRKFHEKFRNRTLSIIGITYTLSIIIAGLVSISSLPRFIQVFIVLITYIIRYIDYGLFLVLIKKYITNHTTSKKATKVYSTLGLMTGLGDAIVGIVGSVITIYISIQYSMITFGCLSLIAVLIVLTYMKDKIGVKKTKREIKKIKKEA